MSPFEFWLAAADWGSYMTADDPGACMYGFDEHSRVQSETHRQQCMDYIESDCRAAAGSNDNPNEDHAQLDAMLSYLKTAAVG